MALQSRREAGVWYRSEYREQIGAVKQCSAKNQSLLLTQKPN